MKFGKPTYDSSRKIYKSEITEGLRCETRRENGVLTPSLDSCHQAVHQPLLHEVVDSTKTWFSKPITQEWLKSRIQHSVNMPELGDFEGTLVFELVSLAISKEVFLFLWNLVDKIPDQKISFDEAPEQEQEDLPEVTEVPVHSEGEVLGIGPTRRKLFKEEALAARRRAARLLYKAEILTQQYCELYGDETDWEEDDASSTDSESE
jgi:hypothetical protein